MRNILKKLALLALPVAAYFCVFAAFEPNNYFGLKSSTSSEAPVARLKAYAANPGPRIIVGDSRLAHFDMEQVEEVSGRPWQNLAFGGASLREGVDVVNWALEQNPDLEEVVFGLSFYTVTETYDADRMSSLEKTLTNPLAYMFNLEYNVNMLTALSERLRGIPSGGAEETGDWAYPEDYTGPDGTVYELHTRLATYPEALLPRCKGWTLNEEQLARFCEMAAACRDKGVALTVVLPPMADIVLTDACQPYGIDEAMATEFLPRLAGWAGEYGFAVLDYEWANRPDFDDDKQFFDGFHLDTRYGLPQWVDELFADIG